MTAFLAFLPILLILVLMIGWQWSAAAAGSLALAVAVGIALAGFEYGTEVYPDLGGYVALAGALAEATFVAATIVWIIFPALCIYELQKQGGALDTLRFALAGLSDDPRIAAILVGWFFALFMEGAAGFGTPVALAAPILVSLGFAPVQALTLALIGHAAGVSFGAIGTPIFPQMAVTGYSGLEIGRWTALLHASLGWILVAFLAIVASRGRLAGAPESWRGTHVWGWVCLAAPAFLIPYLLIASLVGPELPTLLGALAGAAVFVMVLRRRGAVEPHPSVSAMQLVRSGLPYLVLLGLILATRLIPAVRESLQGLVWQWSLFGTFSGSMQPLYHPGTMLLVGFILGGALQGRRSSDLREAAARAGRRLLPVVVALIAMLSLSRVMVHAGMIAELAETVAGLAGAAWPLLVPAVGVLGSFVTGSATASNILLTDFQEAAARSLGLPVLQLVAGQGFGAAVGNIVCPHNVIAGAATVGLVGREGEILRRTAIAALTYSAAGGALLYGLVLWFPDGLVTATSVER